MRRMRLDAVWWLVSPQNPLKPKQGMAPLEARVRAARKAARHPRIVVTAIEEELGTRFAIDTIAALKGRFPQHDFVWIMGADNLLELDRWKRWRDFVREVPIAVVARPHYIRGARLAPAMAWLRRFVRRGVDAKHWGEWELPAIVIFSIPLDPTSEIGRASCRTRECLYV